MILAMTLLLAASPAALSAQQTATIHELEDSLVAPCCYRQSIAKHMSAEAAQMREEVTDMVASGWTEQQVLDHYKAQYGNIILIVPDGIAGKIAFGTPIAVLVMSLGTLFLILRRFCKAAVAPVVVLSSERSEAEWQILRKRVQDEVAEGYL
jgi:cytochrome c-type biogenesis protein CcmH/NrfF